MDYFNEATFLPAELFNLCHQSTQEFLQVEHACYIFSKCLVSSLTSVCAHVYVIVCVWVRIRWCVFLCACV